MLAAGAAGRLAISAVVGGRHLLEGDVTGDGIADFSVLVTSPAALTAPDFLL